jgi:hypothetical protein
MEPKFNIDRQRISDEEISKHKDFERLVKQFKEQSLQKAKHDKSWWKSKKVRYRTVIAGATVVCTVTYLALFNNQKTISNDKIITSTFSDASSGKNNTEPGTTKKFISPPSSKLIIPYTAYKVNNSKGAELQHPTASKIKIPKNAFVDKNGKDIVGEVTIEYREFHDKADVIAGGIPMAYDSAGVKRTLETAGMFDIKGSQNGEPVFIKDEIKVELASANPQDRFNQYYLDTVERNWKYLRRDNIDEREKEKVHNQNSHVTPSGVEGQVTNKKLETLKRDIEVIIPKKIDSVKVVYTRKAETLPRPKAPLKPVEASGKQTFNIDADPKDFPELTAFGNFVFELGDENTNYNPKMNDVTWNDVRVSEGPKKGVNYLLTLRKSDLTVKLIVYPVLSGKDFDKAQKNYSERFAKYESLREKRNSDEATVLNEMKEKQAAYFAEQGKKKEEYEKEKIKLLAQFEKKETEQLNKDLGKLDAKTRTSRIFNISRFGIFNSDCPHFSPTTKPFSPIFLADEGRTPLIPGGIYVVNHSLNIVKSYDPPNFGTVALNLEDKYSFVIFCNNKTFFVGKEAVKKALAASSNKFITAEIPESADNVADLRKALEI